MKPTVVSLAKAARPPSVLASAVAPVACNSWRREILDEIIAIAPLPDAAAGTVARSRCFAARIGFGCRETGVSQAPCHAGGAGAMSAQGREDSGAIARSAIRAGGLCLKNEQRRALCMQYGSRR